MAEIIPFIQQTAEDYDLPYDVVLNYYQKNDNCLKFYDALEEHVKNRNND